MRCIDLLKFLRRVSSSRWVYLTGVIVKESLFKSMYRGGGRKSIIQRIMYSLMLPSISDGMVKYNLKWFIAGFIAGLLINIWIPLISYSFNILGGGYYIQDILTVYITFIFLISIIITIDLVHQVISSLNELKLVEPLSHMPIESSDLRKAVAYSGLFGGGWSLVLGISIAVSLIAYTHLYIPSLLLYIPIGITNTFIIVYPLSVYLYSKLYGRVPSIISLILYVMVIGLLITLYLVLTGYIFKVTPIAYMLLKHSYIYPINYVVLSLGLCNTVSIIVSVVALTLGILLTVVLPSRISHRFVYERSVKSNSGLRVFIMYGRTFSIAVKDILVMFRNNLRLRQFYGQTIAFILPVTILLLYPSAPEFLNKLDMITRAYIISYFGVLSYIVTAIVSPLLVFVEGCDSLVNYHTPLNMHDIVFGKSLATVILLQPAILVIALTIGLVSNIIDALIVVYSMTTYSLLSALVSNYLIISSLIKIPRAWSELSIGILKRIIYTFIIVSIMFFFTPFSILFFILDKSLGLTLQLLIPLPVTIIVMYRMVSEWFRES